MAKFLFTGWPYPGCLNAQMAVAHGLAARGHTVSFYNGSRMGARITGEGFEFFPFGPTLDARIEALLSSPEGIGRLWSRPWQLLPMFRAFFLHTVPHQVDDLNPVLDAWEPDVIVCERPMWGPYLILAELRQIPVAILEYATCLLPGPDISYPGLGFPPPHSWLTRLRDRVSSAAVNTFVRDIRQSASRLRQGYRLPPLASTLLDLSRQLPLTLVPSSPAFDYNRRDLPRSVHYVGPCLWYPPAPESLDWLASLPRDQPLAHVSEGTLYSQEPVILRAAAQGLADQPMNVIMTTGEHRDKSILGSERLASNIVVKRWIPHSALLPQTDVMVTHGGGGTVVATLAAGVPMVIVPLMWDQTDNAQRVVHARAGVQLTAQQCSPGRLRAAVERVLNDSAYRHHAQRIAASFQAYGGPAQAAQLLEGIVPGQA